MIINNMLLGGLNSLIETQSIFPSNTIIGDLFGWTVAIDGNTIVVSAPWNDGAYPTNPNKANIYIYVYDGTNFVLQQRLGPFGTISADTGQYLALYGDTLAFFSDNLNIDIYTRTGSTWSLQQSLSNPSSTISSMTLYGDTFVFGDKNYSGSGFNDSGRVYVYIRTGTTWTSQTVLNPPTISTALYFGASVSLYGDTLAIGSPTTLYGKVYVYIRTGTTWSLQQTITPAVQQSGASFGNSVSLYQDDLIIGAPLESYNGYTNIGAAYYFSRAGSSWTQQQKILSIINANFIQFGKYFSCFLGKLIIGDTQYNNAQGQSHIYFLSGNSFVYQQSIIGSGTTNNSTFGNSVDLNNSFYVVGSPFAGVGGRAYIFKLI